MLRLYKDTAVLAFRRALQAWPAAFSLVVYAVIIFGANMLFGSLGLIGGLLVGLVAAACSSGYLHLLSRAVEGRPLSFDNLKEGFGALFWDVISVGFALWIIGFLVTMVSAPAGPNAPALKAMASLAMAFFLSPVPELLYQQQTRSFALLMTSARFMLAHPLVWFLPTVLFVLVLLAPTGALQVEDPRQLLLVVAGSLTPAGVFSALATLVINDWWSLPLMLLFVHYAMVFRGLLFQALETDNPRRRAWIAQNR
jgi:hypothetical protein